MTPQVSMIRLLLMISGIWAVSGVLQDITEGAKACLERHDGLRDEFDLGGGGPFYHHVCFLCVDDNLDRILTSTFVLGW